MRDQPHESDAQAKAHVDSSSAPGKLRTTSCSRSSSPPSNRIRISASIPMTPMVCWNVSGAIQCVTGPRPYAEQQQYHNVRDAGEAR